MGSDKQRGGGLWSRLFGAWSSPAKPPAEPGEEVVPTFDEPAAPAVDRTAPLAGTDEFPVVPLARLDETLPENLPVAELASAVAAAEAAPAERCTHCGAVRAGAAKYCLDCGLMFPDSPLPVGAAAPAPPSPAAGRSSTRLAGRYEITADKGRRGLTTRHAALDHGLGGTPLPVLLLCYPLASPASAPPRTAEDTTADDEVFVGNVSATLPLHAADWPELNWEKGLLERVNHPAFPKVLDSFEENGNLYCVLEQPTGTPLWEVNDDPGVSMADRFECLAGLAEGLKALHDAGAVFESFRPDILVRTPAGHLMFTDWSDLLPLPLPAAPALRGTLYTPPEIILDPASVTGRAGLYSFGAMLYALYLGHELTELDFERPYVPKPFVFRFPDANPALSRVIMKTFVRDAEFRFPSDEAVKTDPTGLMELARALRNVGHVLGRVRLDVAGWTNTGKVRTNNEDAFYLLQSSGSKEDMLGQQLLIILCDGMGGYEAGEVAAGMAIDLLRQRLQKEPVFAGLIGDPVEPRPLDTKPVMELLVAALRDVSQQIYQFSRTPQGKRGMGCTAEVVYIDGQRLVMAHVGDSRTYHYTDGRLVQLTRDQTLVNRLVELGQLTPKEAEDHPRKNELQQALGAQPIVEPLAYSVPLKAGDWVLVCSDGLINHVDHPTLTEMIQRADSAEMCARRLVNLANAYGGVDNTTVVAVRST